MSPVPGMPGPPNPPHGRFALPAGLPAPLTASPTALTLVKALRRCWLRAICLGLVLAAAAGAATWYWLPPAKVTARTVLRIDPNSKFIFPVSQTNNLVEYQRTQIGLLKSRRVLSGALEQHGVSELATVQAQPDPLVWLEKEVTADFLVAQNLMRITMLGHNPDDLRKLVTAVRQSYKQNILDKERDNRNDHLKKLTDLRQQLEDKLKAKRNAQGPLAKDAGGADPAVRSLVQAFRQQELGSLERDLLRTKSELLRCRTDLEVRRAQEKSVADAKVPPHVLEELLNKEPMVLRHLDEIARLNNLIPLHRARSGRPAASDPDLQKYLRSLEEEKKALADAQQRATPLVLEKTRVERRAEVTRTIHQLEVQIATHQENVNKLTEEATTLRDKLQEMAKSGNQLDGDRDEVKQLEWLTKHISDQEAQQRIEIQQASEPTELIEDTVILRADEEKRLILMTVAAFGCTLILVLLAFAFWEFHARRIGAVDDVSQGLGLNLMGTLPDSSARAYGARAKGSDDDGPSLLAEAVDATRTILLRSARKEGLRVVMVTSAHSGEGKTSLSTHLAASLAQVGYRTLFIDGDLRNPIAHRVFGLESEPGFCELLRGEATTADLLRQTGVDLLTMIPAGRWDADASRGLGREGFLDELLQALRRDFDFVIIDSSPVLPVVDPLLIGQQADGTILSVLRDVSRMPSVYAAHQRLLAGGVKVLGAVVNGVRGETYGATYYYRQRAGA